MRRWRRRTAFTRDMPVPAWMRREFDGRSTVPPVASGLQPSGSARLARFGAWPAQGLDGLLGGEVRRPPLHPTVLVVDDGAARAGGVVGAAHLLDLPAVGVCCGGVGRLAGAGGRCSRLRCRRWGRVAAAGPGAGDCFEVPADGHASVGGALQWLDVGGRDSEMDVGGLAQIASRDELVRDHSGSVTSYHQRPSALCQRPLSRPTISCPSGSLIHTGGPGACSGTWLSPLRPCSPCSSTAAGPATRPWRSRARCPRVPRCWRRCPRRRCA